MCMCVWSVWFRIEIVSRVWDAIVCRHKFQSTERPETNTEQLQQKQKNNNDTLANDHRSIKKMAERARERVRKYVINRKRFSVRQLNSLWKMDCQHKKWTFFELLLLLEHQLTWLLLLLRVFFLLANKIECLLVPYDYVNLCHWCTLCI